MRNMQQPLQPGLYFETRSIYALFQSAETQSREYRTHRDRAYFFHTLFEALCDLEDEPVSSRDQWPYGNTAPRVGTRRNITFGVVAKIFTEAVERACINDDQIIIARIGAIFERFASSHLGENPLEHEDYRHFQFFGLVWVKKTNPRELVRVAEVQVEWFNRVRPYRNRSQYLENREHAKQNLERVERDGSVKGTAIHTVRIR